MTIQEELKETAEQLVAEGKGILAIDESSPTCNKRFEPLGIAQDEENRRAWRELLLTTPNVSRYVSGAILYDETIRQATTDGTPFAHYMVEHGILPGIKVDTGAKKLAGFPKEKVTEGLDGLRERLIEYRALCARFAKWRAVIAIGDGIPTEGCIHANAHALVRYAALCQEVGLVPIIEPEVLINGDHTIERSQEVSANTFRAVFAELANQRVDLAGAILKPSMITAGLDASRQASVAEVADRTVACLLENVPQNLAGIAFLSGGQSSEQATIHLNAMNTLRKELPWPLTFSFGRALQQLALEAWLGKPENVAIAQEQVFLRAKLNGAAATGRYRDEREREAA